MTESDREYYLARALTERDRGERTADPVVARVHNELANMYEDRVRETGDASRPRLRIAV